MTKQYPSESPGRRQFLVRTGLAAVAASLPTTLWAGRATALQNMPPPNDQLLATVLQRFTYDTYAALLAFEVPGNDCYSVAQGVTANGVGGQLEDSFEADLADCRLNGTFLALQHLVDEQSILPDDLIRTQLSVLINALGNLPIQFVEQGPLEDADVFLDEALGRLIDQGVLEQNVEGCTDLAPIRLSTSVLIAVLLNVCASVVDPKSILPGGRATCGTRLLTPFARLGFVDKQRVFELLDLTTNDSNPIISTLLGPTLLGLAGLLSGTIISATGLVAYSEASRLNVRRYVETGEVEVDYDGPLPGWEMARYQTFERGGRMVGDTVHGWDVFEGYWEGRTEAED